MNNPLRYSDPTGHRICEDMDCKNDGDKKPIKIRSQGGRGGGGDGSQTPIPTRIPHPPTMPTTIIATSTPTYLHVSVIIPQIPDGIPTPVITMTQTPQPELAANPLPSSSSVNMTPTNLPSKIPQDNILTEAGKQCVASDIRCGAELPGFADALRRLLQAGKQTNPKGIGTSPAYDWYPESYHPGPCQSSKCR